MTFKIAAHTKFWSWINVLSLLVLSLCLYIGFMWISDLPKIDTTAKGAIIPIHSSFKCYLVVLLCTCILLMIDGLVLFMQ